MIPTSLAKLTDEIAILLTDASTNLNANQKCDRNVAERHLNLAGARAQRPPYERGEAS
jgi:hypothetical protein